MLIVHCTLHTRLLYEFCFCNCRPTIGLPGILSGIRHGKYRYSVKLEHLVCAQSLVIINYFNIFFLFMNQCVHIPTPMSPLTISRNPGCAVCVSSTLWWISPHSSFWLWRINWLIDWLLMSCIVLVVHWVFYNGASEQWRQTGLMDHATVNACKSSYFQQRWLYQTI